MSGPAFGLALQGGRDAEEALRVARNRPRGGLGRPWGWGGVGRPRGGGGLARVGTADTSWRGDSEPIPGRSFPSSDLHHEMVCLTVIQSAEGRW